MSASSTPPTAGRNLEAELDALTVLVKALAEIAEQPRLTPALDEHLEEALTAMRKRGASDTRLTDFVRAFETLRASF